MTTTPDQIARALKPCPFCGSDEISHGFTQAGIVIGNVECHNCDALVTADDEDAAIAKWNTRTTLSQPLSEPKATAQSAPPDREADREAEAREVLARELEREDFPEEAALVRTLERGRDMDIDWECALAAILATFSSRRSAEAKCPRCEKALRTVQTCVNLDCSAAVLPPRDIEVAALAMPAAEGK